MEFVKTTEEEMDQVDPIVCGVITEVFMAFCLGRMCSSLSKEQMITALQYIGKDAIALSYIFAKDA